MTYKLLLKAVIGLILILGTSSQSYASQQMTIGQVTNVYLAPSLPTGAWITSASWSTDVVGLTYFDAGTWGAGVSADGYWPGTATLNCFYSYSYNGKDGNIHVGSGNEYWYFTCKGYPVSISSTKLELEKGQKADLRITISGASIGKIPPVWESDDKSVANVYSTGDYTATVEAKSPGYCTITCYSYMGEPVECEVHVKSFPPTGVTLSPAQTEVLVGKTVKLTSKLTPSGASANLTWSSLDNSIATVSKGTVTGVAPGRTKIKVQTDNGLTAYSEITVIKNEPTSISLSPSKVEVSVGKRVILDYTLLPEGTSSPLTWSSDDPSIAIVNNSIVTGVSGGETKIRVTTANGLSDYTIVNVIASLRGEVSTSLAGEGSKESPYLIGSAADLRYLADKVNAGTSFEGKHFKQIHNIYINDSHYTTDQFKEQEIWIPIGKSEDYPFKGVYDGDGNIITGIYITDYRDMFTNEDKFGLFGYAIDASFLNITISNCLIQSVGRKVGAIVGKCSSRNGVLIENCHLIDSYIKAGSYATGIMGEGVGNGTFKINNCSNAAKVESDFRAAGIAGMFYAKNAEIYNCVNTGEIYGLTSATGIVDATYGSVYNCCNAGSIVSEKGYATGILGVAFPKNGAQGVYHCVNYGNLDVLNPGNYSPSAIMDRNGISEYNYYLSKNYYISDYNVSRKTDHLVKSSNSALSVNQMKNIDTLNSLNNNSRKEYSQWVSGEDGFPMLNSYIRFLAGIDTPINKEAVSSDSVDIYTIQGYKLMTDVSEDAVRFLPSGIYILKNGNSVRKVLRLQ